LLHQSSFGKPHFSAITLKPKSGTRNISGHLRGADLEYTPEEVGFALAMDCLRRELSRYPEAAEIIKLMEQLGYEQEASLRTGDCAKQLARTIDGCRREHKIRFLRNKELLEILHNLGYRKSQMAEKPSAGCNNGDG